MLDSINQRWTWLEGGLSNIKYDIQSMKTKYNVHDKTLQNEEQHHNDIERWMSEVDEDRVYLLCENETLWEDLLKLQSHSMKYNLIFEDLNETEGENTERVIREFIKTELKIEDEISSQNVHRLRKIKAVYRELYWPDVRAILIMTWWLRPCRKIYVEKNTTKCIINITVTYPTDKRNYTRKFTDDRNAGTKL